MRFVLLFLSENDNVYANTIANNMGISRARMAILIKKLENKGYIEKYPSSTDKRIEVIRLTDAGLKHINTVKDNEISFVIKIIDEIGLDEIDSFLNTAAKIKKLIDNE